MGTAASTIVVSVIIFGGMLIATRAFATGVQGGTPAGR
jgi:hypothetical protein